MTRKFALIAGALFSAISAGALHAQTSSTTKPSSTSMQHAAPTTSAKPMHQDSTTARASTKMAPKHAAWTKDQITEAQEGLAKAGDYKGKVNGVYGRSTRKAIRAYQKQNKLPVTGRLSDSLLTRLHSS
jgi:peptidoglycan hydrolase-like protein with peptidoglycan-binding domain